MYDRAVFSIDFNGGFNPKPKMHKTTVKLFISKHLFRNTILEKSLCDQFTGNTESYHHHHHHSSSEDKSGGKMNLITKSLSEGFSVDVVYLDFL